MVSSLCRQLSIYQKRISLWVFLRDGTIYAGVGQALNFGWNWDNVSVWLAQKTLKETSAPRLSVIFSQAVNEFYLEKPGDDSTNLIFKAINPAHQNPGLPADLSIKIKLIDNLCELVEKLGKKVEKYYY